MCVKVSDSLHSSETSCLVKTFHFYVSLLLIKLINSIYILSIMIQEYRLKIMLDRSVYLVDVVREMIGRILKLQSICESEM